MVLYVHHLFAPDKTRLKLSLESVRSYKKYNLRDTSDTLNVFVGYVAEEYKNLYIWEIETIKNASILFLEDNKGKAQAVNATIDKAKEQNNQIDYIAVADSDVFYPVTTQKLFERCVDAANASQKIRNKAFGALIANTKKEESMLPKLFANYKTFKSPYTTKDELIMWPTTTVQIHGAFLFTAYSSWFLAGKFDEKPIWTNNSNTFLNKLIQKNFTWQLFYSLELDSSLRSDPEYTKLKETIASKNLSYYEEMEMIEEFFKTRKKSDSPLDPRLAVKDSTFKEIT